MQDCSVRYVDFSTVLNFQQYNDQVKGRVSIPVAGQASATADETI
jgi:hypothetical protein